MQHANNLQTLTAYLKRPKSIFKTNVYVIKPWTVKQSFYIHLLVESGQNINNTRQQQHAWITCAQSPARDLQKKCTAYFSTRDFTSCYIVSWCRVSAWAGIWSPQHACCLLYPLGAGQHHLTTWTSVKVNGHLLVWAEAERVGDREGRGQVHACRSTGCF